MKVCSDVPEGWKPLIEKAMKIEGWVTISAYIRELIREDLKRKGLLGVKPENEEKEAVVVGGD